MSYGANINEINKYGYNPLLLASHYNNNPVIVKTLINAGSQLQPYLISQDSIYSNYHTPLMLASSYNKVEVVQALIDMGDDVNYKDNFSFSVLFMAAANTNDVEVLQILINSGANIENSYDNEGNTPLMVASYLSNNINIIRYLISRTSNLGFKNKDGMDFSDYLKLNRVLTEEEKNIILTRL